MGHTIINICELADVIWGAQVMLLLFNGESDMIKEHGYLLKTDGLIKNLFDVDFLSTSPMQFCEILAFLM